MDTREGWLNRAALALAPTFASDNMPELPRLRVSTGFPSTGRRGKRIGECWPAAASADQSREIFIAPQLGAEEALGVLAHEMCHAYLEAKGHGKEFRKLALAVGLTPPMRATGVSAELKERLHALSSELGPWPGAPLDLGLTDRKKQSARQLLVQCAICGYRARVARKWLDVGPPYCGTVEHGPMSEAESE